MIVEHERYIKFNFTPSYGRYKDELGEARLVSFVEQWSRYREVWVRNQVNTPVVRQLSSIPRFCPVLHIFVFFNHLSPAPKIHPSKKTERMKGKSCLRLSVEGVLFYQLIGCATRKRSRQWPSR